MEKTLTIDGKEVTFKSTGAVVKRYKMQFGRDFFADLSNLGLEFINQDFKDMDQTAALEIMRKLNFDLFLDLAWVYAKTADSSIPDPLTWLDSFETFPIVEILPELQDLMAQTIGTKKK